MDGFGAIDTFAAHPTSVDAWQELLAAGRELRNTAMQKHAQAALEKLGVTRAR